MSLRRHNPRPRTTALNPVYPFALGLALASMAAACGGTVDTSDPTSQGGEALPHSNLNQPSPKDDGGSPPDGIQLQPPQTSGVAPLPMDSAVPLPDGEAAIDADTGAPPDTRDYYPDIGGANPSALDADTGTPPDGSSYFDHYDWGPDGPPPPPPPPILVPADGGSDARTGATDDAPNAETSHQPPDFAGGIAEPFKQ